VHLVQRMTAKLQLEIGFLLILAGALVQYYPEIVREPVWKLGLVLVVSKVLIGWRATLFAPSLYFLAKHTESGAVWSSVVLAGLMFVVAATPSLVKSTGDGESTRIHDARWRNYHEVFVAIVAFWLAFATIFPSFGNAAIAGSLVLIFYAFALHPSHVLNASPSVDLRRPRSLFVCRLLSAHVWLNFASNAIATALLCNAAILSLGHSGPLAWSLLFPVVFTGYYFLGPGMLAIAKWLAAGRTRIAVFRRFDQSTAAGHRSVVLPTVGAYGYLVLYSDQNLVSSPAGQFWETQDLLGGVDCHMPAEFDPAWERRIEAELARVDYVVFDWVTTPSASMALELHLARAQIPADRLIWSVPDGAREQITRWIRSVTGDELSSPRFVSRDATGYRFAQQFGEVMKATRTGHRVSRDFERDEESLDASVEPTDRTVGPVDSHSTGLGSTS